MGNLCGAPSAINGNLEVGIKETLVGVAERQARPERLSFTKVFDGCLFSTLDYNKYLMKVSSSREELVWVLRVNVCSTLS